MARPQLTNCSAPECARRIFYVETIYGKLQPIDAQPDEDGNIIVVRHPTQDKLVAVALGKLSDEKRAGLLGMGLHLRTAHHQTCVKAERFRR